MELQKCEGGMTGEQNETRCILTSSNCKTGFYARPSRCQLKMVILAKKKKKKAVSPLYKPLGPELGNAPVTKAEPGQNGNNIQVITQPCIIPHCEVFWQTLWKTKTTRALRESTHPALSGTKCHHQPSDGLQKQWQMPLRRRHNNYETNFCFISAIPETFIFLIHKTILLFIFPTPFKKLKLRQFKQLLQSQGVYDRLNPEGPDHPFCQQPAFACDQYSISWCFWWILCLLQVSHLPIYAGVRSSFKSCAAVFHCKAQVWPYT